MTPSSCLCWHHSRGAGSGGSGPPACPWRRGYLQCPPRCWAPRWWGRGTASQRGAPRRVSWGACGSPHSWPAAARRSSSCPTWAEFTVEQARVAYPYSLIRIRIQSGSRGFDDQKFEKIYSWSKTTIYLSLGLHKGRPSYKRSLQLSKENIQHFKTWNF